MCDDEDYDTEDDQNDQMGFLWMCSACESKPTYITIYDLFNHKREQHGLGQGKLELETTPDNDDDDHGLKIDSDFNLGLQNQETNVVPKVDGNLSLSKIVDDSKKISFKLRIKSQKELGLSVAENSREETCNDIVCVGNVTIGEDIELTNSKIEAHPLETHSVNDRNSDSPITRTDENCSAGVDKNEDEVSDQNDVTDNELNDASDEELIEKLEDDDVSKKPEKRHFCKICGEEFITRRALSKHKQSHICPEIGMFKCDTCHRTCTKYDNFTRHLAIHKENRVKAYSCDTCLASFYNLADLRRHYLLHLPVKPFICEHCGEGFIKQDTLQSHMAKHTGVQYVKFTCKLCGKILNSASALAMHSKNHTKKSVFCPEPDCQFSCYLKSQLRQHMRRHSGEKPFQCSVCGRCFARSNDMKNHILNVHDRIRPHQCPDCNKQFSLLSTLRTHRAIHSNDRPHSCNICQKRFNHPSTLRKHIVFLHRDCNEPPGDGKAPIALSKKKASSAKAQNPCEPLLKNEVTFSDIGVQSVPLMSVPIHLPQISVNLELGYTQTYIIPSVAITANQMIKPDGT